MNDVQIRATHPYGFRNGQWAVLLGVVWANNRPCYKVIFPDMVPDLWPIHDEWDAYEFRELQQKCGCGHTPHDGFVCGNPNKILSHYDWKTGRCECEG